MTRLAPSKPHVTSPQVHPTGFLNPADLAASTKTLCAELLRGGGGVLLDRQGRRFVDELGTRDHISGVMMQRDPDQLDFVILLTAAQVSEQRERESGAA